MLLKDAYILDSLGLSDRFLERDLDDAVLRELEMFLLEMASGFSFATRLTARNCDLVSEPTPCGPAVYIKSTRPIFSCLRHPQAF